MALLSHDDSLIYKSYMLEFYEYKGRLKEDFKNVGNNEQIKHNF